MFDVNIFSSIAKSVRLAAKCVQLAESVGDCTVRAIK